MAKLQSAGLYEPTGLPYLIAEGILPKDADLSSYKWHSQLFLDENGQTGVEEILRVDNSVVWSRNGTIKRVFNLDIEGEAILHAFATSFSSQRLQPDPQGALKSRDPALVVVLKTQAHIFGLSGGIHVIPLLFEVARALPFSGGCVLQADKSLKPLRNGAARSAARLESLPPPTWKALNVDDPLPTQLQLRPTPTYCVTDLLSEVGLVAASYTRRPPELDACSILPSNEEILFMSIDGQMPPDAFPNVCVALSLNRQTSTITVWHVNTLLTKTTAPDQPSARFRKRQSSNFHERSRIPSGRGPVDTSRESFGLIQSFVDDETKAQPSQLSNIENLAAELGRDFEPTGVQTRSARRISSMLARTDLAPANDRSAFNDNALASRKSLSRTVRNEGSFGSFTERTSFGGRKSFPASTSIYSNTASFLDPGNRLSIGEGIGDGGDGDVQLLDDRLEKTVLFIKIKSFLTNDKSQDSQSAFRVLLLPHPHTTNSDNEVQRQLSICVHEREQQVMTVVTIAAKYVAQADISNQQPELKAIQIQKGTNIADACLVSDDHIRRLLVLSKTSTGDDVLHLEAPWSTSYRIDVPEHYLVHGLTVLEHRTDTPRKQGKNKDRLFERSQVKIAGFMSAINLSTLIMIDSLNFNHHLAIQMRPDDELTDRVMQLCTYVLPGHLRESMLIAYWEVTRWLSSQEGVRERTYAALAITLFTLAVPSINALQNKSMTPGRRKKTMRLSSGTISESTSWSAVLAAENLRSTPAWMNSTAWGWLENEAHSLMSRRDASQQEPSLLSLSPESKSIPLLQFTELTREFLQSPAGENMTGPEGYLPTAMNQERTIRRTALAGIVVALYLLLEELKLSSVTIEATTNDRIVLATLIGQLSSWLNWRTWKASMQAYVDSQHPSTLALTFDRLIIDGLDTPPEPFSPTSIFEFVDASLRSQAVGYHTLHELVNQSQLDSDHPLLVEERKLLPRTSAVIHVLSGFGDSKPTSIDTKQLENACKVIGQICQQMVKPSDLAPTPMASPPAHFARTIGKAPSHSHIATRDVRIICNQSLDAENVGRWDASAELDRQAVTRLIFNQDRRFQEASKLVNQARPPEIEYEPQPSWTEADALEAQKLLTQYATRRTFAVVAGRGIMHFMARTPLLTEQVPRAQFSMQCILRPKSDSEESQSMTFSADRSMFTEDKVGWAFFHNGAAAGLMISSEADFIDTSWILYNKPPEQLNNRHAGFLLALGLNGHLKTLAKWVAFKYLTPKHTMTSIGLLLGLAASYRGTADTLITRLLSVHVTCLLPPGAAELNLSPLTQATGIMGIGLLYHDTQHRRMSEVMLSEIENQEPEEPAGDDPVLRDEGYRLAAGMSLGLINLGQGLRLHALHDMRVFERLLAVAVGTKNVNIVQILDRAIAGAVIAIAFIYMKTNDKSVARKVDIPDTLHQFDYVRPDIFLLRTLARHLIVWDGIFPRVEFVRESLPQQYHHRADLTSVKRLNTNDLPFFHVLAGICFAIALRYAGSQRHDARDLLVNYLDHFIRISRLPAINYDGRVTLNGIRNCLDIVALSCSIVMAGSGDLAVYRRLRALHGRTDKDTPFGSHLSAHMAIGALFLSGGTATFGTSNLAVAALVIALYPLFPTDVLDNRSHLQALRHLWVLAVEHRCLVLKDNETGQILNNIDAEVVLKDGTSSMLRTPGLLPDLDNIKSINVSTDSFWPVNLDLDEPATATNSRIPKSKLTLRDSYKATSTGITVYLHRRALYDKPGVDPFDAELAALGSAHKMPNLSATAQTTSKTNTTLDWVFNLPSFSHLDHAERALVLYVPKRRPDQAPESALLETTPIDIALDLNIGTLGPENVSSEVRKPLKVDKLWQIRLLLAWADQYKPADTGEEEAVEGGKLWLRRRAIDKLRWRIWKMAEEAEDGLSD